MTQRNDYKLTLSHCKLQIADCSLQISVFSGFESETKSVIESETESEIQYEIVWILEAKILHINNDHIAE